MGRKIKVCLMTLLVIAVLTAAASAQDITRTITPTEVMAGETVSVTLSTTKDLRAVSIYESFPGSLVDYSCTNCDQVEYNETLGAFVVVDLAGGGFTVTYIITAPSDPGIYYFSGTYVDAFSGLTGDVIGDDSITVLAGQEIYTEIYTDKYEYKTGDVMYLGLNVKNSGYARNVRVTISLETPSGIEITLFQKQLIIPAKLNYSNPSFKVFILPPITPGTYAWHIVISDPTTFEVLSEDYAEWKFTGTTSETYSIADVFKIDTVKFQ